MSFAAMRAARGIPLHAHQPRPSRELARFPRAAWAIADGRRRAGPQHSGQDRSGHGVTALTARRPRQPPPGSQGYPRAPSALVERVWARLPALAQLSFRARPGPRSRTRWCGHGRADVIVERAGPGLRFIECGWFWPAGATRAVSTRNVYLWRRDGAALLLSHERQGAPVPLLRLVAADGAVLASAAPHHCGADLYRATLRLVPGGLALDWTITGPDKDEHLHSHYRPRPQSAAPTAVPPLAAGP